MAIGSFPLMASDPNQAIVFLKTYRVLNGLGSVDAFVSLFEGPWAMFVGAQVLKPVATEGTCSRQRPHTHSVGLHAGKN